MLIRRAETEEMPELIYPFDIDIAQLIKDREVNMFNKSWACNGPEDRKKQEDWGVTKAHGVMLLSIFRSSIDGGF